MVTGPVAHSRWVNSGWQSFYLDPAAPDGTMIQSTDVMTIIDDNNAGNVTKGGAFCLALDSGSSLEVWAGILSGPRWAIALFNRSPSSDTITVDFAKMLPDFDLGASSDAPVNFEIFDVWTKEKHTPAPAFSAVVGGHDTVLLIVTPSA
jgi:hypothetical protein